MAAKPSPVPPDTIPIRTSKHVRAYLDQLIMGGLYGNSANEAAERILTRAIEDLLRRGELIRLPPLQAVEAKEPSGDDGE